jgi:ABC-type spermidine/putrescine transport system permease subunit I
MSVELKRERTRENLLLAGLCLPSVLLVTIVMFIPLGWLAAQSLFDPNGSITLRYFLQLITDEGYRGVFRTSFEISILVVVLCALLGYPLAYLLSQVGPRFGNLLFLCVLVPFWTPVLVRIYGWLVLLQRRGVVNETLLNLGAIARPLDLAHNRFATVIGMVHIMLPYLVLPLYASMRAIPPSYLYASSSLGASPIATFWRVFFPLSLPGLVGGAVLVFILSLGFYVLPILLGGGRVIMIAQRIADSITVYATWGPAAALGVALFVLASGILLLFSRFLATPAVTIER